ncbi:MAG: response regulator [Halioglobus sp.]
MIKLAYRCILLLLLVLALPLEASPLVVRDLSTPVSIAGTWQFKTGDDLAWASPGLDDSDWAAVTVPAIAPEGYEGYSGLSWFRVTIQLDRTAPSVQQQLGALAVRLGSVQSAYELYAGGELIGRVGDMPPEPQVVYDRHGTWLIPPAAVDKQGNVVLALRVWRYAGFGNDWGFGPYEGEFLLGNAGDLRSDDIKSALLPNVVLAALYLAVGLYHLFIARRNPALKEFFWFGLVAVALACYTFERSQWRFTVDLPYLVHKKIEFFSLYIAPYLFSRTLLLVTKIPLNPVTRGFQYLFLAAAALVLVFPNQDIHFATLQWFQYAGAAWAVMLMLILGGYAFRGNRAARSLFVLMLLLVFAVFNDVILTEGLLGEAKLVHWVFALLIILMAVLMANRYTQTLRKLEQSVEDRTVDLLQMNKELQEAVATKGQFLANMSHEIRTPMNAVIGLSHLGLKTELTDQQRDYLTKINQSANGLRGIIDSILDFSKLEEGELECVKEPFSLPALLAELSSVSALRAQEKGLEMRTDFDPDIPGVLLGDGSRLGQVLNHFISNAVKYTERGELSIAVECAGKRDNAVTVHFAVSDTGIGISEAQEAQLFEAFSQADNSVTRQHGGTGLGLAISQQLVQMMGGEISLVTEPGKGSTFSFDLTLETSEAELPLAIQADQDGPEKDVDLTPIQGAKILLVDDSEINLQVASELLHQAQFRVDIAHDGQEAVAMVNNNHYDCILMDVQMPVMDGYTATKEIRKQERFSALPVLAMTANALPQDRAQAKEAGMNAHIPKPIDPQDLYRKLLAWIEPGERQPLTEAAVTVEPGEDVTLPEQLPGLQVSEGLVRVGGNAKLFLKLLRDMQRQYSGVAGDIQAGLDRGERPEMSQLAHKLRGIANNLGASEVGACAEGIELGLKSVGAEAEVSVTALDNALSTLNASIDQLLPLLAPESGAAALAVEDLQALYVQLRQAIEDSNPAAEELAEQLLANTEEGTDANQALLEVRDFLDIYNFADAGLRLDAVSEYFA